MKKIFSTILAVLVISVSLNAQDSRNRVTSTIVGDVLAQMPAQTADAFNNDMRDLAAAAPESIKILAGMLQSADKGANNKIEYAISGVTDFVCQKEGAAYKEAVKKALKDAAAATADQYNKAFLLTQVRLLSPEAEPKAAVETPSAAELQAKVKALMKSTKSNDRCEALNIMATKLGGVDDKTVLKALKSSDRAYRAEALRYAAGNEAVAAKAAAMLKKLSEPAKADVLNWLGDNKVASQLPAIIAAIGTKGQATDAAIEAAGKIGGAAAADALIAQLGTANDAAAMKALRSYPGKLNDKVEAALKGAAGTKLTSLLSLAGAKRMASCAPQVFALAESGNADALAALKGVVRPADFAKVASLLDKASAATLPAYSAAAVAALSELSPAEKFNAASKKLAGAANPARLYPAIASSNTDEAAALLSEASKNGSAEAVAALCTMKNQKAADGLFAAAQRGDEKALLAYAALVSDSNSSIDRKCANFVNAIRIAKTAKGEKKLLDYLSSTPTTQAFLVAGEYLTKDETKFDAAEAVKNIASKCVDDIDYYERKTILEKAIEVFESRGLADDGYALDMIRKTLSESEEPSPVFVLSDDEKKAGYEVLFDGTNLDKWEGNLGGYKIMNNTIYVTAGYGSGGNLYTKKEYRDFVLRFEFCFVRGGANNGIGVRTPHEVDAAYDAMCEVQVLDHDDPVYAGWLKDHQVHGSVYGVIPAKRIKHKPLGEWSTEEIIVKGDHVTVTVNGEVITDGDIREACQGHNVDPEGSDKNPYTVDHKNHPGMFNEKGYICFCGHGAGVKFRNVRVLDLGGTTPKKAKRR